MPTLRLTFLGLFAAHVGEQEIGRFPTDKVRALLAYLVLAGERPHRRESLATLLWPDWPDVGAKRNLRQAVYHLRQLLDEIAPDFSEAVLAVDRQTIRLLREPIAADVWQLAAVTEQNEPSMAQLGQVANLYHGELLAGFALNDAPPFDDWLRLQREQFHQHALSVWHKLAEGHLAQQQYGRALQYAQRQIALEPWREVAHRQAMRALWQSGQRTAALAQYTLCREALDEELGVLPEPATEKLYAEIGQMAEAAVPTPTTAACYNFPTALTPFIGRRAEVAQAVAQLAQPQCRLLNLIGAGGMGKTRLATAVAEQAVREGACPSAIYFVPLAAVASPDLIPTAIAESLHLALDNRLPVPQQLFAHLRQRPAWLVLDNFEHLLAGGARWLGELLTAAEGVKLLVTSREPLQLRAEWRMAIDGLADEAEAVRLFSQAAQQMSPQFALNAEAKAAVAEIVQLVQGMPLALEMAAGWVRLMDCATIARQIRTNLDLLHTPLQDVPERQRSIRAVFEYTWQTLPAVSQNVLVGLGLFRGGFHLEAAVSITPATLPVLAMLVDKALLRYDEASQRYEMHELLRQFVAEKGGAYPELIAQIGAAHGRYYLAYLRHDTFVVRLDLDNVRQAWQWAVAHQEQALLSESVSALATLYNHLGLWQEAYAVLMAAVQQLQGAGAENPAVLIANLLIHITRSLSNQGQYPQALQVIHTAQRLIPPYEATLRAHSLLAQAQVLWQQGSYAKIHPVLQECLALAQTHQQTALLAHAFHLKGNTHWSNGEYAQAVACYQQSHDVYNQLHDSFNATRQLGNLGVVYWKLGHHEQALDCYYRIMAMQEERGNRSDASIWRGNIGLVYLDMGNLEKGLNYLDEALAVHLQANRKHYAIELLLAKTRVMLQQGSVSTAVALLQQAQSLAGELNNPSYLLDYQTAQAHLLHAQGETAEAIKQFQHLLLREFRLDKLAALHETVWRLTGDEQHTAEAMRLYQLLDEQNPNAQFRRHLARLAQVMG
ncbi:MAG: BTAD domain-containing putative transcriptional regulator [Chloroflexi bacterium]|nr:BTAD domain-containing putative transcriptional regulator [Chloroflexota bacterium]